jgi:hypothetical protein
VAWYVPGFRDPHHPEAAAMLLGGALALAATWARFPRSTIVRLLAWAAVLAALFALSWRSFVADDGRRDRGRDRFRWEWEAPRLRTG